LPPLAVNARGAHFSPPHPFFTFYIPLHLSSLTRILISRL
jgi:hypothetical protein